ncbi:MAG: YCF48-related protein [Bacteroidia bacterium]|nr:YCF48-related protein [Bacteroidia bacterium]
MRPILISFLLVLLLSCKNELAPKVERVDLNLTKEEVLRKIKFGNDSKGLLVGGIRFDRESILFTEDGGLTWESSRLDFEYGKSLFDLSWINDTVVFASGLDGKILRSEDSGRNFSQVGQTDWLPLYGIDFQDSIGIVVGGVGFSKGTIWRSEDWGGTWTRVDTPETELRDVVILENGMALACGFGVVFKSEDGGKSWKRTEAQNEFFTSMFFQSEKLAWVLGRTGSILKTIDGGENWEMLRNGNAAKLSRKPFNDIYFESPEKGYLVGDDGTVMQTLDGGNSWTAYLFPREEHLYGLSQREDGAIFVAGERGGLWHILPE